jgi:hypothetical protein
VGFAGALVGGRGIVTVQHRAGAPAGQAHQVGLAAALGEPLVGEGVAELVGCRSNEPISGGSPAGRWRMVGVRRRHNCGLTAVGALRGLAGRG